MSTFWCSVSSYLSLSFHYYFMSYWLGMPRSQHKCTFDEAKKRIRANVKVPFSSLCGISKGLFVCLFIYAGPRFRILDCRKIGRRRTCSLSPFTPTLIKTFKIPASSPNNTLLPRVHAKGNTRRPNIQNEALCLDKKNPHQAPWLT